MSIGYGTTARIFALIKTFIFLETTVVKVIFYSTAHPAWLLSLQSFPFPRSFPIGVPPQAGAIPIRHVSVTKCPWSRGKMLVR